MSKKLYFILFVSIIFFFSILKTSAQEKINISKSAFKNSTFIIDPVTKTPSSIRFREGDNISIKTFFGEYKKAFGLSEDNEIKSYKVSADKIGQNIHRYKQYYKGIELGEVQFILHEKNEVVLNATGNLIGNLKLDVTPSLTESEALRYALKSINAESYMWESKKNEAYIKREQNNPNATMYPKGILMLSAKNFDLAPENFHLVYRFDIYAEKPMDRYYVDVDARTSEIINKISRIQSGDVPGQGTSVYNGNVSLTVADTAINSLGPSKWHPDTWNAYAGVSWWVGDPSLGTEGGYDNYWYEVLDTDPITLTGTNPMLEFYHRYKAEDPAGGTAPYNGWDGMNVRISTDDGDTWQVLQNPTPAYTRSSLYSFGEIHGEGSGIPGWAGELNTWTNVSFSLSAYADQTVKIRFAFASDLSLSTNDGGPDLFGWQVDNISITSSSGTLYNNDGNVNGITGINYLSQESSFIEGNYRLREYGRGGGIATYDAKHGTAYQLSTDFVDDDTNFNLSNSSAGVSIHWALENAYDYYLNNIGRNSFDDEGSKMIAYAHYGDQYDNAFWDGIRLTFGDGTANSTPLVSIDIVAHELTHGVTQYTAGLIYQNEQGALNESFSDIFGTAVEFNTLGSGANWFMGEGGARIRSMSNPNQYGNPDTYFGEYWNSTTSDYGGVHTNSGVQNYWFYLLSEGGSGVNDNGYSFNVTALGMDQAAQISYRNLSSYLVSTSEYDDARLGSMYATIDLYGDNSPQLAAVIEAWNAVGVLKPALVATLGLEVDTINFLAEASATTDTVEVTISNYGLQNLEISNIEVTGSDFQLLDLPSFPVSLDYDGSIAVKVVFAPEEEGNILETLSITSNDAGSPGTITLNGKGYVVYPAFDKVMYASSGSQNSGNILSINKQTGEGINIGPSTYNDILDLTISPQNKLLYALRSTFEVSEIHRIDVTTGISYLFVSLDLPSMAAIAFDTSGALYGALQTGEIYSINLDNSSYNLVSTADIDLLAMTFDPVTNELWGTVRQAFGVPRDKIYKIDLNTGDTTFVGQTGFNTTTNDLVFDENGTLYGVRGSTSQIADLFTINVTTGVGTVVGSTGLKGVKGLAYAETGITDVKRDDNTTVLPKDFSLSQNYPNPFNPSTNIKFQIAKSGLVNLKVYDILGRETANLITEEMQPGSYEISFDASALSSGVYFYKLQSGSFVETKKMILLR